MQTKLTLRLDDRLIQQAKRHARRSGRSLSVLVADMFRQLQEDQPAARELTPVVRSLAGALKGKDLGTADYRRHLESKHR
jgi:hypothetical protein